MISELKNGEEMNHNLSGNGSARHNVGNRGGYSEQNNQDFWFSAN